MHRPLVLKVNRGHKTPRTASGKAVKELPLIQHILHPRRRAGSGVGGVTPSHISGPCAGIGKKKSSFPIRRRKYPISQTRESAPTLSPRADPVGKAEQGLRGARLCPPLPFPGQRPSAAPWPDSRGWPRAPPRPRTALPATPVVATCCRRSCGGKSRAEAAPQGALARPRRPTPRPPHLSGAAALLPRSAGTGKGRGEIRAGTRPDGKDSGRKRVRTETRPEHRVPLVRGAPTQNPRRLKKPNQQNSITPSSVKKK